VLKVGHRYGVRLAMRGTRGRGGFGEVLVYRQQAEFCRLRG